MAASDEELKSRVEEILRNTTRVDENEVRVEVRGACVTLTGEVDSAIEKRHARHLAQDVEGVQRVSDHLQVKNFVRVPDAELAEAVRNHLQRDAFVEGAQIEVYANGGEVQLDGSVLCVPHAELLRLEVQQSTLLGTVFEMDKWLDNPNNRADELRWRRVLHQRDETVEQLRVNRSLVGAHKEGDR